MKRIDIHGRRWWNKRTGSTYHSVSVEVDGVEVFKIPFAYGYDQQYLTNAMNELQRRGLVSRIQYQGGSWEAPWVYAKRVGVELNYGAMDVNRKKDL
jgi:hypothetical protein